MRKRLLITLAVLLAFGSVIPSVLASTSVIVSPTDMKGWAFGQESGTSGAGQMVLGPDDPPLGVGSANLVLQAGADGWVIGKADYTGVRLADLDQLSYYTYVSSAAGPAQAPSLQFNFTLDVNDPDLGWQGRISFEPYLTNPANPVSQGDWQEWDALTLGGWWATNGAVQAAIGCDQTYAAVCTLEDIVNQYPDAGIHPSLGAVLFKAGSGWANFNGNVDAFTIGANGDSTTYNFEPGPADKNDCKKGGWQDFGFKNQGQCIRFVNTGQDSR